MPILLGYYRKLFLIRATLAYVLFIVAINVAYVHFPFWTIAGAPFSSGDMVIGCIYILRDFSQREVKHYVIIAMLIGATLSYFFANQQIAIASVCSFTVGETIDWLIYTLSRQPLSQRLLWSSAISVPIDTLVFLTLYGPLNIAGMLVISISKIIGVVLIWYWWRIRHQRTVNICGVVS